MKLIKLNLTSSKFWRHPVFSMRLIYTDVASTSVTVSESALNLVSAILSNEEIIPTLAHTSPYYSLRPFE